MCRLVSPSAQVPSRMLRRSDVTRTAAALAIAIAIAIGAGCAGTHQRSDLSGELAAAEERIAELEAELEAATVEHDEPERARDPAEPADRPHRIFAAEGLDDQLRSYVPVEGLPEGFEPGPTEWHEAPVPPGFGQNDARGHATAGALANAVAARVSSGLLGIDLWEVTTRVLVDDDGSAASAAILMWGLKDDAGEGDDLRLKLRDGERGWYVEAAQRRFWCRRGVTGDQRCR
jgi:hypothetical protein